MRVRIAVGADFVEAEGDADFLTTHVGEFQKVRSCYYAAVQRQHENAWNRAECRRVRIAIARQELRRAIASV